MDFLSETVIRNAAFVIVGVLVVFAIVKILRRPIKWFIKLIMSNALAVVALLVMHFLGGYIGLGINLNVFTVVITVLLGLPGLLMLLFLHLIF
jgi:inhibitor of the pro-sigma K processing machinery